MCLISFVRSELRATLWPVFSYSPQCLAISWTFTFSLVAFLVYACVTSPQTEVTALTSTTDIDTLLQCRCREIVLDAV